MARDRTHDGWHARLIAIANFNHFAFLEVDAAEVLDKRRDEVLARLLAIADDIDAGLLLFSQRQTQGVLFPFD